MGENGDRGPCRHDGLPREKGDACPRPGLPEKGDKEGMVHKVIGESQVILTSLKKSLPLTLDITTFYY